MEKIRLNGDFKEFRLVPRHGYELEPQKKYVISLADELKTRQYSEITDCCRTTTNG